MTLTLEADVSKGVVQGFGYVCLAFEDVRAGFLHLVEDLAPDEWERPSRCHLWSVHDVVRHVRDGSRLHLGMLRGDPVEFHPDNPYENREVPLEWLAASEGERPEDTVDDLREASAAELAALDARAREGGDASYVGPYGDAHWTVLTTHVFWDTWLHQRDVSEPLGRRPGTTRRQDLVAALYALLVASVPAAAFGDPLDTRVRLTTGGSPSVDALVAPRHVTVRSPRPDEPADLDGELSAVVDAIAGRGAAVEDVLSGAPERREAFTRLRGFMTPSD